MSLPLKLLVKPAIVCSTCIRVCRSFHRWQAPTLRALKKRKDQMEPLPVPKRSDYLEWNSKAEIYAFGKRLGEEFKEDFLCEALTEKSYINLEVKKLEKVGVEPELLMKDNSNFAHEGEKFMSRFVLEYLETVLPALPSEYIRAIRDDLLNDEKLSYISKNIGIDDLILSAEFPPEQETLSRAFKGVIQALILSSGHKRAYKFIKDFVLTQLCGKDITPLCTPEKPLEKLKSIEGPDIESRLIAETGKNSLLANYQVGIYKEKKLLGRGCGESPWMAEEMAALDALWKRWGISSNKKPFPIKAEKNIDVK